VSGIWALTRVLASEADAQASATFISRAVKALRKAASSAASRTLFLIAVCQVWASRAKGCHRALHTPTPLPAYVAGVAAAGHADGMGALPPPASAPLHLRPCICATLAQAISEDSEPSFRLGRKQAWQPGLDAGGADDEEPQGLAAAAADTDAQLLAGVRSRSRS